MSVLFVLIYILSNIQYSFTINPVITSYIDESVREYVNLHLLEELLNADKLIETSEGQKWLFNWEERKNFCLRKVFLIESEKKNRFIWHNRWREYLSKFQELQTSYFQAILKNRIETGAPSYWPRVTLETKSSLIALHSDETLLNSETKNYRLIDRIATEKDIEQLLRFHRPLSDVKRKEIEDIEEAYVKAELSDASQPLSHDIDPIVHGANERKILRPHIKQYDVINKNLIQKFIHLRYNLLRESFRGKPISYLLQHEKIFQAERVTAQLDVLRLIQKNRGNDINHGINVPFDLRLLENDEAYRRFLNHEAPFQKGNIFYGHKNRIDDPAIHGYDFEMTAMNLLGKRYDTMYLLYEDMKSFKILSNNFKKYSLKDLPTIEYYLERFKSCTLWFNQKRFNGHQWVSSIDPEKKYRFFMLYSVPYLQFQQDKILNKPKLMIKSTPNLNMFSDSLFTITKRKINQMISDVSMIKKFLNIQNNKDKIFFINKMINFINSYDKANLLPYLSTKIPFQQLLESLNLQQRPDVTLKINRDTTSNEQLLKKDVATEFHEEKIIVNADHHSPQLQDSHDSNSNDKLLKTDDTMDVDKDEISKHVDRIKSQLEGLFNSNSEISSQNVGIEKRSNNFQTASVSGINQNQPNQFGSKIDSGDGDSNLKRSHPDSGSNTVNHQNSKQIKIIHH